jgi:single-stranded DNA-binding protein
MVVVGRLQRHSWTAEDGSARSAVEVTAEELHQVVGFVKQPDAADLGLRARREGFEPQPPDP